MLTFNLTEPTNQKVRHEVVYKSMIHQQNIMNIQIHQIAGIWGFGGSLNILFLRRCFDKIDQNIQHFRFFFDSKSDYHCKNIITSQFLQFGFLKNPLSEFVRHMLQKGLFCDSKLFEKVLRKFSKDCTTVFNILVRLSKIIYLHPKKNQRHMTLQTNYMSGNVKRFGFQRNFT